ncbi:DNA adenine methylase [Paratractidigestivibacter faecalis]|uniref:DNA adenine methylase n=1 Tax=Paratractidigestivibacter faecalis TaxID=2292441 RepID=UPI003D06FC75
MIEEGFSPALKPMIKYRGGKSRELSRLLEWVPDTFDRYIEPFFGGGALYFAIAPDNAVINDLNARLMSFYGDVADNYDRMRTELDEIESVYESNRRDYEALKQRFPDDRVPDANEALYYSMRAQFNGLESTLLLAGTLYYYINKTAYSGMIRYNNNGEFNVPYGRYKHFNTRVVTEKHSVLLRSATRMNTDFENVLAGCGPDDFVFLDPPYDSPFSDYGNEETKDGFSEDDHRRLADLFFALPCKALLVIGSTPLTESLYGAHVVSRYSKSYAVNIRNRFKANSEHILVTNK